MILAIMTVLVVLSLLRSCLGRWLHWDGPKAWRGSAWPLFFAGWLIVAVSGY